jgi:hypothetical protein
LAPTPAKRAWLLVAASALLTATVLSACGGSGGDRSAEAYCRAFYEHAAPIRKTYVEADKTLEQDPLKSVVTLLGAPGDLASIFGAMVDHAPDEIRSDTEAVRDAFKKQQESVGEALSDPLGAIGDSLGAALTTSGSFARVESYLQRHCPVNSTLAQEIINETS